MSFVKISKRIQELQKVFRKKLLLKFVLHDASYCGQNAGKYGPEWLLIRALFTKQQFPLFLLSIVPILFMRSSGLPFISSSSFSIRSHKFMASAERTNFVTRPPLRLIFFIVPIFYKKNLKYIKLWGRHPRYFQLQIQGEVIEVTS